ncbi:MAG: sigma-54 dependent transcriptional regulator [bacterium]|nr:sigma-54 dependent transcriptional regulator [bacterium]
MKSEAQPRTVLHQILIVDDEEAIRLNLGQYFRTRDYEVREAGNGKAALELCRSIPIDVVLLDLRLPDQDGLEVLKKIKSMSLGTGVIIITAYGDVETAVKAIQLQADNFVLKPIDLASLEAIVRKILTNSRSLKEIQYLRRKTSVLDKTEMGEMPRQPAEVHHAINLLAKNSSTNILIMGETGTGKGMVARIIHELSDRKEGQFVDINCAGLSGELLESELFGHERGAFTDAKTFKRGLLEVANGGSLFLDEVAELSLSVQAKILKVIEEKVFRRLGGTTNNRVDVRIMAATNTNLEKKVKSGKFREDLFFRLNVMPVVLPPLRERRDDILPLAKIFLDEYRRSFGKSLSGFTREADRVLEVYAWPGNIRELRNVVERAVLLCEENLIGPEHLPDNMRGNKPLSPISSGESRLTLSEMEKKQIQAVLDECGNNQSQAAKILGIHRSTLIRKIKEYQIM